METGSTSEKPIPGSTQRGFGCGKMDTREVITLVRPWRIMIGLCPEKVTLDPFIQSQITLTGHREVSL